MLKLMLAAKLPFFGSTATIKRPLIVHARACIWWRPFAAKKKKKEKKVRSHAEQLESLAKERAVICQHNVFMADFVKRVLSDSVQIERRLNKKLNDAKNLSIQLFCRDLLDISDVLEHILESVPVEKRLHCDDLFYLYENLKRTHKILHRVFKQYGLKAMEPPIYEKFNPEIHVALYEQTDRSLEPQSVVAVIQLGYKLNDRVVRPALVGVSKH
ncbi:grpE protein homolog, mitochondrial-like [Drosophila obscura]|uniref:grpE protein homolog, mitochondrial-like n=1 Tax=Drosophila obscura TaxID=7282 RepID=UPI000BA1444A|nr:grpE protein homolog, mitochondrial-like [Drosophila obscura]